MQQELQREMHEYSRNLELYLKISVLGVLGVLPHSDGWDHPISQALMNDGRGSRVERERLDDGSW